MTKKLKIRFVKFEKVLAMQILEQEGVFKSREHIRTGYAPSFEGIYTYLRGEDSECDNQISSKVFFSNAKRDEYLNKVIKWISEEQFATGDQLVAGTTCEVSDDEKDWVERKLIAILPEKFEYRYIAQAEDEGTRWYSWLFARSVSCVQPKIDGDVYTWEMEGGR